MKQWPGRIMVLLMAAGLIQALHAEEWSATYGRDHPLTGKIWDSRASGWIEQESWLQQLQNARILLLGETHTNEDHHRLQGRVIEALGQRKRTFSIVFEMFTTHTDQTRLEGWSNETELLQRAMELAPNWPWRQYRPLLSVIARYRPVLRGSNLDTEEIDNLFDMHKGLLEYGTQSIDVRRALNPVQREYIGELIDQAHCGYIEDDRLTRSIDIQIARDASFALTLARESASGRIAVMIVGAGHVRKDLGIPAHLLKLGMVSKSVLFAPVRTGENEVASYVPESNAHIYDFVYFTANDYAQDPCIEFRAQLKQLKESHKNAR